MLVAAVVALHMANPCTLLDPLDITRVLGWTVTTGKMRSYAMPGGTGRMCSFDSRDGSVIITIPTKGTGLPTNDLTSDLGSIRTPLHDDDRVSLPTEIGHGAALVHARGGHDYGITVQPISAQFANDNQMRALASALIARLPPQQRHH